MNAKLVALATVYLAIFARQNGCEASNILYIGAPSYGHYVGPANLAVFLRSQGHNVRMVVSRYLKERLQKFDVEFIVHHGFDELSEDPFKHCVLWTASPGTSFTDKVMHMFETRKKLLNVHEKMLRDDRLIYDIKHFQPDLILVDSSPLSLILTLVPYKLNIPFVMLGDAEIPQFTRTPVLPSIFPHLALPYTDQMNFQQRLLNAVLNMLDYFVYFLDNPSLAAEIVPEKPYASAVVLAQKASLWITVQQSVLSYNAPLMPNVKRVGNLQSLERKPLPEDFSNFMVNSQNGVIVVSFGSVLSSVPSQIIEKLLEAFDQTKYDYIIQSPPPAKGWPDNFMFRKWLPQFDLLLHPNTRLFISHCGTNGVQEALSAGVPVLGLPVYGDQPDNAKKLVRKGFGLMLDLASTSAELVSAIQEITTTSSYYDNVQKAANILKSERKPVEEAAYWINHVLMFGDSHLRSYAQDVPLWKYLGLDIIAFCLLLWHILVYVLVRVLKRSLGIVLACFYGNGEKVKHE